MRGTISANHTIASFKPSAKRFALFAAVGAAYTAILLTASQAAEIFGSIAFVIALVVIAWRDFRKSSSSSNEITFSIVAATVGGLAVGMLLPPALAGKSPDFFWAIDSITTHVPRAEAFADWLRGKASFPFDRPIDSQGGLTHIWIGTLFSIFGQSAAVTVLGLAVIRIATCFVLIRMCRELFGTRKFDLVYLVYAIYPNALFHTTVYFKEAFVHLLVALTAWIIVRFFNKPRAVEIPVLAGLLCLLFIERFYLVLLFMPLILVLGIWSVGRRQIWLVAMIAAIMLGIFFLHPYFDFSMQDIAARLKEMRDVHSAFPDVNVKMNYEIPYIMAILKSIFTPFLSPAKIDMFRSFSALITWGALLGQVIILAYLIGVFRASRQLGWLHIAYQLPFAVFVLAIAYISPWAGRVRDSMCPLIVAYATFYFVENFQSDIAVMRSKFSLKPIRN